VVFLTFLIIFKLYNGGLEHWAENPHVSNAETVVPHAKKNTNILDGYTFMIYLCGINN